MRASSSTFGLADLLRGSSRRQICGRRPVFAEYLILARRPLRRRDRSVTHWDAGPSRRGSRHFQQPDLNYPDDRVRLCDGLAALHPQGDVSGKTDLSTQRR